MNDLYLVVIDSNDTEQYDEIIHILRNNRFTIKGTPKRGFVWNIITPKILKQILMERKNEIQS